MNCPVDRHDSYKRQYQAGEWFRPDNLDLFSEDLDLLGIYECAGSLSLLNTAVGLENKPSIAVEFGSGDGPGLVALSAYMNSGDNTVVIGSEQVEERRTTALSVAQKLSNVDGVVRNGYTELEARCRSVDLVFAHMFGSISTRRWQFDRLLSVTVPALTEGGALLLNSDPKTMQNVFEWIDDRPEDIRVTKLSPEVLPSGYRAMPHLIVQKLKAV